MRHILFITIQTFFAFIFSGYGMAQSKEFKVGDKIPSISNLEILNYKKTNIGTNEFKGKFIILDFWATWCAPCVSFLGRADSLMNKFKDDIVIIPVTYESESKVKSFLNQYKKIKDRLPMSIVDDTVLNKMFPHNVLPHEIWIDPNGVVCAITGSDEVTSLNIFSFIKNRTLILPTKFDEILENVDFSKPVLTGNQKIYKDSSDFLYSSVLTKYNRSIAGMTVAYDTWLAGINIPIVQLYKMAFGESKVEYLSDNRVVFEMKDSLLNCVRPKPHISNLEWHDWRQGNTYCYEIRVKDERLKNCRFQLMQDDLNRYFKTVLGIVGSKEKRKITCLVLSYDSTSKMLESKGGQPEIRKDRFHFFLKNKSINQLVSSLQGYYLQNSSYPLLNETKINSPVDLDINCDLADVKALNKEFLKYKLRIDKKEREIDVIVIKKVN